MVEQDLATPGGNGQVGGVGASGRRATFTVGTLIYHRANLVTLFAWLLWGDFIFNLMQTVMPSLLPLILKRHHATDSQIAIIVNSLFMLMNMLLNPVISYRSDRTRTRWGRRRPYILLTTPLVVLFLALIPYAPNLLKIVELIPGATGLLALSPTSTVILMFGVLVVGFQIFNMFISSVYYYLIVDVVPAPLIGRFYGLFRFFGSLAGVFYSFFIFPLAKTHMAMIFLVTALLYGVCIMLMAWRVKEGQYPPPEKEEHGNWYSGIKNYARECFGCPYYWWVFLVYGCYTWAGAANVFGIFFFRDEIGLSLAQIGKIGAIGGLICMAAAYPVGVLIDRWGSHKTLFIGFTAVPICSLATALLAHGFWSAVLLGVPATLATYTVGAAILNWTVAVYPRARYGQFGSAGAMCSSLVAAGLSPLAGWLIDYVHSYRLVVCLWPAAFSLLGLAAALVVYQRWKALGAPDHYQPP